MADTPSYKVVWLPQTRAAVRQSSQWALQLGRGRAFTRAVKELDHRLRVDPLNVGEVYHSRGNVENHHAVLKSINIDFGVDKKRKLVLVRAFQWLVGIDQ